jgi:hypothetical protein
VNFLAAEHPEMIGIAPDILGHSNPRTTERYYRSLNVQAGARMLQATLQDAATERKAMRQRTYRVAGLATLGK